MRTGNNKQYHQGKIKKININDDYNDESKDLMSTFTTIESSFMHKNHSENIF